jgi:uncharacterized LabA/DUF88 family protein
VLFVDYQNVYMGARRAFFERTVPSACGQFDPVRLGEFLVASSPFDRHLHEVRVYRGRPDATLDQRGHAACTRQSDIWSQDPRVKAVHRTLRYPYGWPERSALGEKPQEKGIDVALAIDFAMMGHRNEYDVGILFSTDTDLKPALEAVAGARAAQQSGPRAEVAAWSMAGRHSSRLSIPEAPLWCHWLDEDVYNKVADLRRY